MIAVLFSGVEIFPSFFNSSSIKALPFSLCLMPFGYNHFTKIQYKTKSSTMVRGINAIIQAVKLIL